MKSIKILICLFIVTFSYSQEKEIIYICFDTNEPGINKVEGKETISFIFPKEAKFFKSKHQHDGISHIKSKHRKEKISYEKIQDKLITKEEANNKFKEEIREESKKRHKSEIEQERYYNMVISLPYFQGAFKYIYI